MVSRSTEILHELSGGKDSSFALFLLKSRGFSVVSVFLKMFEENEQEERARHVARRLGSELRVLDLTEEFRERVVNYFIKEYELGRTPNPCVVCNREIKFGRKVKEFMKGAGIHTFSTGHYARTENGRLFEGPEKGISQAYFLSMVKPRCLGMALFPMGNIKRNDATSWYKKTLGELPLPTRDICFLADKSYRSFLDKTLKDLSGPIYDTSGKLLGHHRGIHHYTVGQRRMLPGGFKKRMYVVKIDPKERAVYVGDVDEVIMDIIEVKGLSWIRKPEKGSFEAEVRARYRSTPKKARIHVEGDTATVHLKTPEVAPAPGQVLVINAGDEVLGGGFIEKGWKSEKGL